MDSTQPRRKFIRLISIAGVAVPASLMAGAAHAKKNDALRTALQYQPGPKGELRCDGCLHYKAAGDKIGGCAIMPGDDEIDASGWCSAWVKKA